MSKFLQKIFSVKQEDSHIVLNLFFIKFKKRIAPLKPVGFFSEWELDWSRKFLADFSKMDAVEKYNSLVKNLDKKDITLINRILVNQKAAVEGKYPYTAEEKQEIARSKSLFHRNILKLNDECFIYKNYRLPINAFEMSLFEGNIYKLENLVTYENLKDKDFIDVGAFVGDSALVLSEHTDKNIYAFEPSSSNYNLLCKTIQMNDKTNIIPVNYGLGSKNEELTLYCAGGGSSIVIKNGAAETVKITTLDEYVENNNIVPGLIKVDVEGFEQEFLKGAEKTIKKYKPVLLLSIYHNADDFFSIKPLIESWGLGYKFKVKKMLDGLLVIETTLVCEVY